MLKCSGLITILALLDGCSTEPHAHIVFRDNNDDAFGEPSGPSDDIPEDTLPKQENGFRLEARRSFEVIHGQDGSTHVVELKPAIWDNVRKEECSWGRAEDGLLRCMPASTPIAHPDLTEPGVELRPILGGGPICNLPLYLLMPQVSCEKLPAYIHMVNGCDPARRLYKVMEPMQDMAFWLQTAPGGCASFSSVSPATHTAYHIVHVNPVNLVGAGEPTVTTIEAN